MTKPKAKPKTPTRTKLAPVRVDRASPAPALRPAERAAINARGNDVTIYARVPPVIVTHLDALTATMKREYGYANRSHAMRAALVAGFKALGVKA